MSQSWSYSSIIFKMKLVGNPSRPYFVSLQWPPRHQPLQPLRRHPFAPSVRWSPTTTAISETQLFLTATKNNQEIPLKYLTKFKYIKKTSMSLLEELKENGELLCFALALHCPRSVKHKSWQPRLCRGYFLYLTVPLFSPFFSPWDIAKP